MYVCKILKKKKWNNTIGKDLSIRLLGEGGGGHWRVKNKLYFFTLALMQIAYTNNVCPLNQGDI